jgi:hypothetical protein
LASIKKNLKNNEPELIEVFKGGEGPLAVSGVRRHHNSDQFGFGQSRLRSGEDTQSAEK